jgi:hypothetical protein
LCIQQGADRFHLPCLKFLSFQPRPHVAAQ